MPEYRVHLHAAEEVAKRMDLKETAIDIFKIGSILPDAPWYCLSGLNEHDYKYYLHRYNHKNGTALPIPDYNKWIRRATDKVGSAWQESPLHCGFLFHLVIDASFNHEFNEITKIENWDAPDAEKVFKIQSWIGKEVTKISVDHYMELKVRDISCYSANLPYCPIRIKDVVPETYKKIENLCGERVTQIPEIIEMINDDAMHPNRGRNILFTDQQYTQMIKNAQDTFLDIIR